MRRILLTALLIVTANTASALQLSIKHDKDLPTPWQLMSKVKIIDQRKSEKSNSFIYYIAWDKTDDFYVCGLTTVGANCRLIEQTTMLDTEK